MAEQDKVQGNLRPQGLQRPQRPVRPVRTKTQQGQSFADVLRSQQTATPTEAEPLKFSGHAQSRMESRGIRLSSDDVARIEGGVDRAATKGGRESLVLMDDLALVVSVKNRTVITVIDGESRKENVFTQIDSAVVV
ncbi:MAG: hypothetical protein GF320_13855 [Armatimonadia bacterium]|nr:hypothetical protein [Armatimonadia bacterium]